MKAMKLATLASLSCLVALASSVSAFALMIAPAPIAQRVATADSIVIGKVTSLEEKTVSAPRFPGDKEKGDYTVAVVKVQEGFGAAAKLTHVRVGFIAPMEAKPIEGKPGIGIRPIRRYPQVVLAKDQEVILFLQPHFDASFQVAPAYFDVIQKANNPNFEKETAEVKRYTKLLADAKSNLDGKNAEDRFLTAAMLLVRYRTAKQFVQNPKQEAIDAGESKRILLALADADWNPKNPGPGLFQMNPQAMFYRLGVTEKDGWTQPKDFKEFPAAAQKWLKENAGTYRIQRFVGETAADKEKGDK
jgi:hypothetical protein